MMKLLLNDNVNVDGYTNNNEMINIGVTLIIANIQHYCWIMVKVRKIWALQSGIMKIYVQNCKYQQFQKL